MVCDVERKFGLELFMVIVLFHVEASGAKNGLYVFLSFLSFTNVCKYVWIYVCKSV